MTCTAATNSAPSSRYSSAREPITTISDRALLMGCFCTSRLLAAPMHTAPKMMNKARCMIVTFPAPTACRVNLRTRELLQRNNQAGDQNICNRQRQQELPTERHQLVVTEAGQRALDPDVNKDKSQHLHHEPDDRQECLQNGRPKHGARPSAKEQNRSQAGHGEHVGVLGHEEHGE